MNWPSIATAAGRLLRMIGMPSRMAPTAASALMQSITLERIVDGVRIAESLPWADMFSALEKHFSDPEMTVSTVEEVLQALAPFIPGVVPFEEAAQVIALLCRLNLIQAQEVGVAPVSGSGSKYFNAPFI